MQEAFELEAAPDLVARYNVAPTQEAPVVLQSSEAARPRHLAMLRWGLVPEFAREPSGGARAINARSESVASRPTFRESFRQRRCLVPANGFYEWQARGRGKQPYLAARRDGLPFAFAGLWSEWRERPSDTPLRTFAILTCPPNRILEEIHDRMPVVLDPERYEAWLDPDATVDQLKELLRPAPEEPWEVRPVSQRVNSVRNDDVGCLDPPAQSLLF